jgi:hypothetical protein
MFKFLLIFTVIFFVQTSKAGEIKLLCSLEIKTIYPHGHEEKVLDKSIAEFSFDKKNKSVIIRSVDYPFTISNSSYVLRDVTSKAVDSSSSSSWVLTSQTKLGESATIFQNLYFDRNTGFLNYENEITNLIKKTVTNTSANGKCEKVDASKKLF